MSDEIRQIDAMKLGWAGGGEEPSNLHICKSENPPPQLPRNCPLLPPPAANPMNSKV